MVPPGKGLLYPYIQKTDDERAEYTLVGPMNAFQRPLLLIIARISKLTHRSRILPPPGYPITADMISVEAFERAVIELDRELDELWERKRPALIDDLITYDSADEVFRTRWRRGIPTAQRVTSLHRAAIISLFRTRTDRKLIESPFLLNHRRPGEIWDDGIDEQPPRVAQAVEDILTVTRDIVKTKTERERRFMLWPLVCAGLECREVHDQEFILHVLDEMSYVTWGTNFQKTKALLQEIFKRQGGVRISPHGHGKMEGRWRRVDWLGVMQEMGPIVFV
jgi:Fungal specific transcription factor domain